MKPKLVQSPSVDDVRIFLEDYTAISLLAAQSSRRGLTSRHPGADRVYDWLQHYAETGTFPSVI